MNAKIRMMACVILSVLVVSMDSTITNTTMPIIVRELGGFEYYAWSFAAYMIMSTVVTPVAGRISDLFGRKKVFGLGLLLFLIGSLLCGFSQSMLQLILFRAFQGIGAGVIMPFPSIIAGDLFSIQNRGKMQAFFTGMWGISAILAPLLGALFVQYWTWRWIFYVNIPICLIAFALLLPYKEVYVAKRASVDYGGAVLFSAAVSSLLAVTVVASHQLWYVAGGVVLALLFIGYEKRQASPIIPFTLFRNRNVAWMSANSFLACAALFGSASYIPLALQREGYSILVSGVALLGTSIGWMAVAVPAGKWLLRFSYRPLLIWGSSLLVLTGVVFLFFGEHSGFWFVFAAMILQGLSYGLTFTISTIGAQQLVEPHQKGVSTSVQMFARNIGTAVSVTIMGALLNRVTDFYEGMHSLFLYGFIISLLALLSSFFIRERDMR